MQKETIIYHQYVDQKNLTDQNFNNGASYILSNLNKFSLFSGTHNEESIYKIINIMETKNSIKMIQKSGLVSYME